MAQVSSLDLWRSTNISTFKFQSSDDITLGISRGFPGGGVASMSPWYVLSPSCIQLMFGGSTSIIPHRPRCLRTSFGRLQGLVHDLDDIGESPSRNLWRGWTR